MTAVKIAISLDETTAAYLDRLSGDMGRSPYLRHLIERRVRDLHDAWAHVSALERGRAEVVAAMAALNGCWLTGHRSGAAVAMELHDWARLSRGGLADIGVSGDRWAECVAAVRASDDLARALVTLATEWWAVQGGSEVERLVERLGPQ